MGKRVKPTKEELQKIKNIIEEYFLETGDIITDIRIGGIGVNYEKQEISLEGTYFETEDGEEFTIG